MAESSFQRLLRRMPEDTRRRFCCSALEQELQEAKKAVSVCLEAAAHAQQVREATQKLQSNSQSGAPVTSKSTPAIAVLLTELDELQKQFESALAALGQPHKNLPTVATPAPTTSSKHKIKKDAEATKSVNVIAIKTVVRSFDGKLQTLMSRRALSDALNLLREFVKHLTKDVDANVQAQADAVYTHELKTPLTQLRSALLSLKDDNDQMDKLLRLRRSLKKLAKKNIKMADFMAETEALAIAKEEEVKAAKKAEKKARKKKRKLLESLAGEESDASNQEIRTLNQSTETDAESAPLQAADLRKLLNRCTKEVKALIDRFDLGKFDLNLKRMIDVMNSISSAFTQEETATLATTLFCLVEAAEKIGDGAKRKDRLVCLEGVLRIFITSTCLPLTNRQRSMAKEYLANNQQSLHVLQTPSTGASGPTRVPTKIIAPSQPVPAPAPKKKTPVMTPPAAKDKRTKIHVHFDE